jgi:hypothetical protein
MKVAMTMPRQLAGLDLVRGSASLQKVEQREAQYFRKQGHRMDYPRYMRNARQIWSEVVESARKTLVGGRPKGSGMRGRVAGTNAVCHLRALYLSVSVRWDAFGHSAT